MVYAPLEHIDAIGLEEFALLLRRLQPELSEASAEHSILRHMFGRRWLGVKTGVGFYRHARAKLSPNRALERWLRHSFAGSATPMSRADQKTFVQQRLGGRMVNEAYRCLGDAVVKTSDEIDLALMLAGWAPHRGGPCRYAEQVGYAATVAMLEELAKRHGERFAPCAMLRRLAGSTEGNG